LRVAHVQNDLLQIVIRIDAYPIATDSPHRPVAKHRPSLSQSTSGIRFQLIAHRFSRNAGGPHHDMHVRRSRIDNPGVPAAMLAVPLTLAFDDGTLLWRRQHDFMLQSLTAPLGQPRLRRLFTVATPTPARIIALKMRAVDRPRDKECERLVGERAENPS
jgi:hypothetical protein